MFPRPLRKPALCFLLFLGVYAVGACGARTGLYDAPILDAGADTTVSCAENACAPPPVRDASSDTRIPPDGSFEAGDALVFDGGCSDGTTSADACSGLACQVTCPTTAISGKVFDPAGTLPVYNAFVYVPNGPVAPMVDGPVCETCAAPASGTPIVGTTTGADGSFTLVGAPTGTNIPVILQIGKWRRRLVVPKVEACGTTTPEDGFFRFPRKQHETSKDDNIPLMAITTGCDAVECFFTSRLGIDASELSGPDGSGRVHVYKSSNDDGQSFPGTTPGAASDLWGSTPNLMMRYDIVFDACECDAYDRGGAGSSDVGYKNFLDYLNAGGRAFATHYFYNFFANETQCDGSGGTEDSFGGGSDCYGQGPLPSVGAWEGNQGVPFAADVPNCPNDPSLTTKGSGGGASCLQIDTAIPKGAAFSQWYQSHNTGLAYGGDEKLGYVGLTDLRTDVGELASSLVTAGTATPWLYAGDLGSRYDAYYFSVNAPVGTSGDAQCGRAVFSDVHVAGGGGNPSNENTVPAAPFPTYCTAATKSDHAPNELALEFLVFDLSSCVQDDRDPPMPPPPACK
jgi:hypothetical protein